MTITAVFSLSKELVALCFVFLLVPFFAEWRISRRFVTREAGGVGVRALQLFVHASLAAEIGCLLLGRFGLCLPGIVFSVCVLFVLYGTLPRGGMYADESGGSFWPFLLNSLEDRQTAKSQVAAQIRRHVAVLNSPRVRVIAAVIGVLVVFSARSALTQFHFAHAETYTEAVSLAALTEAQSWEPDGSIALLAPLVSFSGLDAASVVRLSGPIFTAVFILILALCMFRIWRTLAAVFAVATLSIILLSLAPVTVSEWSPALVSGVYWIAAGAIWPLSRRDSMLAAAVALLISPTQWLWASACLALLLTINISLGTRTRVLGYLARIPATAICALTIGLFSYTNAKPLQMVQYESAARVCDQISRQFHRKEWIIVSPFQELAFTYGRGWHVELSDFVSKFTVDQVSRAKFALPYDCPDVFFFVERRPISPGARPGVRNVVWRYSPAESADWSAFLYTDPVGRESLEYRAMELLNAYARYHENLSVFYADNDIVVYHLVRS
jgi:hypothetical protein